MKKSDINPLPEYFDRYINLSDDIELSEAFEKSLEQLNNLDKDKLAKLGDKIYAPGKWTAKEVFQHIIDWERILASRTLLFARLEVSIPQNIDENLLAANMSAEKRTIDELIEELKIARLSTKAMFESFDAEMLLSKGMNWKYEMSVLAMGFNIIGHQIHHLSVIEDKYFPLVD
jgi:DinB superfamily